MDLEKIATSAIVSSISKTDTLSGFINDGEDRKSTRLNSSHL